MTSFDDSSNDDLDGVALDQDDKAEFLTKVEAGDVEAITAYAKRFQENHLRALQPDSIAFFAKLQAENLTAWLTLKRILQQQNKKIKILDIERLIKQERDRQRSAERKSAPYDGRRQSGCEMREAGAGVKPGLYSTADEIEIWLAQIFEVSGICLAPEENREPARTVGILLRFRNSNKRDFELLIGSDVLQGNPSKFAQILYEVGFVFDCGDAAKRSLQRYLANYSCPQRILVVARAGWYENNDETAGFMLPREAVPLVEGYHLPMLTPSARTARYAQRGTFAQWRDNAAYLAGQHTLGVFRMSTALTSPLLKLASQEGGVFHLFGTSSGGKSTLDYLAATVWGRGSRESGFSRTWSSTANGFEGTAAAGNDIAVFLDDTSHVIDAKSIVAVVYMVSGGQGKTRLHADSSPRETSQFRIIVNSNGEEPIPVTLKAARIVVKGGIGVRCVDIAAAGVGKDSPDEPGAAFDAHMADWPSFAAKAAEASLLAYGHAGPLFVRKLIEEKVDYKIVNDLVSGFVNRCDVGLNGQLRRVAMRIGLVAAAGELAIEFGIFPWPKGSALEAADFVFKGWLDRRGSRGSSEMQQALERVQLMFEKYSESRFDECSERLPLATNGVRPPAQNRLGWTRLVNGERRWYVLPQTWKVEFCRGFDDRAFNSELEKLSALEIEAERGRGKRPPKVMINGDRKRCFTITERIFSVAFDPSEGDDAE